MYAGRADRAPASLRSKIADAVRAVLGYGGYQRAVKGFLTGGLWAGSGRCVWAGQQIGALRDGCTAGGRMSAVAWHDGRGSCGRLLPRAHW